MVVDDVFKLSTFFLVTYVSCISNVCRNCETVLEPKPFSSCVLITMTGKYFISNGGSRYRNYFINDLFCLI